MKQLTKQEMLQRLDSPDNLFNIVHRGDRYTNGKEHSNGRAGKFTDVEKENIVALSAEIGPTEAAALVNCHPQSIGDFKRGISSHRGNEVNFPSTHQNQEVMERIEDKVSARAVEKVLRSIDLIEDDKLVACNAVELATIASRLSSIGIKKGVDNGRIQVNIYTPQIRTERDFETVLMDAKVS